VAHAEELFIGSVVDSISAVAVCKKLQVLVEETITQ
jgi:hypothetical protein